MAGILSRAQSFLLGRMPNRASPFAELGTSGTAIYGGFIVNKERNSLLQGTRKHETAADMLANISIVAAGLRYFLNLVAKPSWKLNPPNDTVQAKAAAEFMESIIHGGATSWSRNVRRSGMYKFHGFHFSEWTALKRPDGKIGFGDIEVRPQHTIERWQTDPKGTVEGVYQRSPQDGTQIWLPRVKLIYLVDDVFTDSPEGLGWFRNLVEPVQRLKQYLTLEGIGFERDLSGTPVGRAPLAELDAAVKAGTITREQANEMLAALNDFVKLQVKKPSTSITIDSKPYQDPTADGTRTSGVPKWGIDLLQATAGNMPQLGSAIERLTWDMARIIGVENMLTGSDGVGSLALSKDKSQNLYLSVNATLDDMGESYNRDLIDPIWALNGLPDELKPKLVHEDAAFKDVEQIAAVLRDMSTAGATLMPDDPAINDVRDLLGIEHAPEVDPEMLAAMMGTGGGTAAGRRGTGPTQIKDEPSGNPRSSKND